MGFHLDYLRQKYKKLLEVSESKIKRQHTKMKKIISIFNQHRLLMFQSLSREIAFVAFLEDIIPSVLSQFLITNRICFNTIAKSFFLKIILLASFITFDHSNKNFQTCQMKIYLYIYMHIYNKIYNIIHNIESCHFSWLTLVSLRQFFAAKIAHLSHNH